MKQSKGFFCAIRKTQTKDWSESLCWLLYILIGSLLPIYLSMIPLKVWGTSFCLADFTKHAEFSIYSASVFASAAYFVLKDYKRPFPRRSIFGLIVILGIITAAVLYASVTISPKIELMQKVAIDANYIQKITLILFGTSIIIAYITSVLDSSLAIDDIMSYRADEEAKLKKEFESIGG